MTEKPLIPDDPDTARLRAREHKAMLTEARRLGKTIAAAEEKFGSSARMARLRDLLDLLVAELDQDAEEER